VALYPDLLRISLIGSPVSGSAPTKDEALAYLLRCKGHRRERGAVAPESGSSAAQLAAELSYDVALINLARACSVNCDVERFDQPHRERSRIEHELTAQGVCLVDRDEEQADRP
jgi:hypothetical protein